MIRAGKTMTGKRGGKTIKTIKEKHCQK